MLKNTKGVIKNTQKVLNVRLLENHILFLLMRVLITKCVQKSQDKGFTLI